MSYINREKLLKIAKEIQGNPFGAPLIVKAIEDAPAEDVVVLPCKIGQTIYLLWAGGRSGKAVVEAKIINISLDCHDDMEIVYRIYSHKTTMCRYAKVSDLGNTLFITREEAERALGRGDND